MKQINKNPNINKGTAVFTVTLIAFILISDREYCLLKKHQICPRRRALRPAEKMLLPQLRVSTMRLSILQGR